jgi:hypothetical protein
VRRRRSGRRNSPRSSFDVI